MRLLLLFFLCSCSKWSCLEVIKGMIIVVAVVGAARNYRHERLLLLLSHLILMLLSIDTSCALIIQVECFAPLNTFFEMVGLFFRMSLRAVGQSATTFLVTSTAFIYATLTCFCDYDWQWVSLVMQVSVSRRLLFWMLKTFSLLFFLLLLNIDKACIVPLVVWRLSVLVTKVVDVLGLDGQ